MREALANSKGTISLQHPAIDFPEHVVEFTQESYFEFALRSLDEILYLVQNGELLGMQPGQFSAPISGRPNAYIKRRVA